MRVFIYIVLSACLLLACNSSDSDQRTKQPRFIKPKIKHVGLQPFTDFPEARSQLIKTEIEAFYDCKVSILPPIEFPEHAWYAPRSRYRADSLIAFLRSTKADSLNYVMGLCRKDISTTKEPHEDWGILGLGYCPGSSCIVSTYRLKKSAKNEAHLNERLVKVSLHELGHNFGLRHCTKSEICLMRDAAGTVKTVDEEAKVLCDFCRKRI